MFLTLPSNSSLEFFPQNSLSAYRTKLPTHVDLRDGEWEVGLSEILYPHTWYNVTAVNKEEPEESNTYIIVYYSDLNEISVAGTSTTFNVNLPGTRVGLPPGLYASTESLLQTLNRLLGQVDDLGISFRECPLSRKVQMIIPTQTRVHLSTDLQLRLGFTINDFSSGTFTSERVADVNMGVYAFYVYCDLVTPRIVGDTLVPLLRMLPTEGKQGAHVSRTFDPVHYHPVSKRQFDTVEMNIKDDQGRLVPFELGKVIITLHLRRRN